MRAQHEKSCDNSPHLQRTMDSEASTSTTRCAFHARIICPSIALEAFRLSGNGNPRCIFYLLAPHAANLRHPWRIPWIFVCNKTKTSSQKFTYLHHECACFSTKTNLFFFWSTGDSNARWTLKTNFWVVFGLYGPRKNCNQSNYFSVGSFELTRAWHTLSTRAF